MNCVALIICVLQGVWIVSFIDLNTKYDMCKLYSEDRLLTTDTEVVTLIDWLVEIF